MRDSISSMVACLGTPWNMSQSGRAVLVRPGSEEYYGVPLSFNPEFLLRRRGTIHRRNRQCRHLQQVWLGLWLGRKPKGCSRALSLPFPLNPHSSAVQVSTRLLTTPRFDMSICRVFGEKEEVGQTGRGSTYEALGSKNKREQES